MNKIFLSIVTLAILFSISNSAQAQANIRVEEAPLFDLNVKAINRIMGSSVSRFEFETANIRKTGIIDHWKVRVWCNDGIAVGFNKNNLNMCGKVAKIPFEEANDLFYMFLNKPANVRADFSLKLKAYDKNGKWLHSEGETFAW